VFERSLRLLSSCPLPPACANEKLAGFVARRVVTDRPDGRLPPFAIFFSSIDQELRRAGSGVMLTRIPRAHPELSPAGRIESVHARRAQELFVLTASFRFGPHIFTSMVRLIRRAIRATKNKE